MFLKTHTICVQLPYYKENQHSKLRIWNNYLTQYVYLKYTNITKSSTTNIYKPKLLGE